MATGMLDIIYKLIYKKIYKCIRYDYLQIYMFMIQSLYSGRLILVVKIMSRHQVKSMYNIIYRLYTGSLGAQRVGSFCCIDIYIFTFLHFNTPHSTWIEMLSLEISF